ncbi:type II secretion system minor pseudopilin GspI [Maricaulis sp.]|uniref:type II secretion system minor pseudopilin GspI n=1 Tax=Maricaulis sp. TaxID=1486257 RepID=UPI003A91841C
MTPCSARNQSGFSLIEVMMALVVLALGGIGMLSLMQSSTRNAAVIQERTLAVIAAENLLNQALLQPRLRGGDAGAYELADNRFDWQLQVEPTTDPDLQRVIMLVTAPGTGSELARLETFRRGANR